MEKAKQENHQRQTKIAADRQATVSIMLFCLIFHGQAKRIGKPMDSRTGMQNEIQIQPHRSEHVRVLQPEFIQGRHIRLHQNIGRTERQYIQRARPGQTRQRQPRCRSIPETGMDDEKDAQHEEHDIGITVQEQREHHASDETQAMQESLSWSSRRIHDHGKTDQGEIGIGRQHGHAICQRGIAGMQDQERRRQIAGGHDVRQHPARSEPPRQPDRAPERERQENHAGQAVGIDAAQG